MPVKVATHENSSTTFIRRTFPTKSADFAIFIHLIVFQHSQLDLLSLMLVLLWGGVRLLLPFLSATTKSQHEMESGLLLVEEKQQHYNIKNSLHGLSRLAVVLPVCYPSTRGMREAQESSSR